MRYEVDVEALAAFNEALGKYVEGMNYLLVVTRGCVDRPAKASSDAALAGAARDVNDTCDVIEKYLIDLYNGPGKTLGEKVNKYQRILETSKGRSR